MATINRTPSEEIDVLRAQAVILNADREALIRRLEELEAELKAANSEDSNKAQVTTVDLGEPSVESHPVL